MGDMCIRSGKETKKEEDQFNVCQKAFANRFSLFHMICS